MLSKTPYRIIRVLPWLSGVMCLAPIVLAPLVMPASASTIDPTSLPSLPSGAITPQSKPEVTGGPMGDLCDQPVIVQSTDGESRLECLEEEQEAAKEELPVLVPAMLCNANRCWELK